MRLTLSVNGAVSSIDVIAWFGLSERPPEYEQPPQRE